MKNSVPPKTKNTSVHGRPPIYSKYDQVSSKLVELEATAPLTDEQNMVVMSENPQVKKFLGRLAVAEQAKEIKIRKSLRERGN